MPFQDIELNIWDIDNCVYPYDDEFNNACHQAAATAAIQLGANLSMHKAVQLSIQSFAKFYDSYEIFACEYGIDRAAIHSLFHKLVSVDFLDPCPETIAELSKSPLDNAALSHSSTEWVAKVLSKRGYIEHFHEYMLVGIDGLGFSCRKHTGKEAFWFMLNRYRNLTGKTLMPSEVTMVDDDHKNLIYPKQMGMKTVQITYGKKVEKQPHIDYVFNTPLDFLKFQNENTL